MPPSLSHGCLALICKSKIARGLSIPTTFSCLYVILILISLGIIHIPNRVMFHTIYRISCHIIHAVTFKYSYKHAIIVQGPHIVTCITYHIRLSSIHNIHSRSHDFVLKHIKLAYNLMTRSNPRACANIQQITRNLRRVSHLLGRP